jgi:hypothetical protein
MIHISLHHYKSAVKSLGKFAVIDDEDYESVSFFNWSFSGGYAFNVMTGIHLHSFLMNPPPGLHVDHINGDRLDNRRENLRIATTAQNQMNKRSDSNNLSGYKGVQFDKGCIKPWAARIQVDGSYLRLGNFYTKEEAALTYNEAAIKHYGPWARLNNVRA